MSAHGSQTGAGISTLVRSTAHASQYLWFAILGFDLPRKGRQGVSVGILGVTGLVPTSFARATIPSGRPFAFEMTRTAYNFGCTVNVAFELDIGKDYESCFSQMANSARFSFRRLSRIARINCAQIVNTSRVKLCTYWDSQQGRAARNRGNTTGVRTYRQRWQPGG